VVVKMKVGRNRGITSPEKGVGGKKKNKNTACREKLNYGKRSLWE